MLSYIYHYRGGIEMFTKLVKHQLVEKDLKVSDLARLLNTSFLNLDLKILLENKI